MQITPTPYNGNIVVTPKDPVQEEKCPHCGSIFKKAMKEKQDDVNELRLAYTGQPKSDAEVNMLKLAEEMIKRNW